MERVLYHHMVSETQGFRILVGGQMTHDMTNVLYAFANFLKTQIPRQSIPTPLVGANSENIMLPPPTT